MPEGLITVAYIVSAVLFVLSLRGLSNQETARRGNMFGIAGMVIAVVATVLGGQVGNIANLILVMLIGGGIGLVAARRVAMTEMPELVAILHSFVGAAAVLVGIVSHLESGNLTDTELIIYKIENFQIEQFFHEFKNDRESRKFHEIDFPRVEKAGTFKIEFC